MPKKHLQHHVHHAHLAAEPPSFFSQIRLKGIVAGLFVVCLFLLVLIYLMNNNYNNLKEEFEISVSNSDRTIAQLNSDIAQLLAKKASLETKLSDLQSEYDSLSSSNNSLSAAYNLLKTESSSTIAKIDAYESEIQKSMAWFKENSLLSSAEINASVNLRSNCIDLLHSACEINLGCFNLVNLEFVNYKYKSDISVLNVEDKLQSISEFVNNRGGDCEDYTLFFKAEYNSLVVSCEKESPRAFGWVKNAGTTFWANLGHTWYLPNAKKVYLDINNIFPVGVCGSMLDPNTGAINGHCVLAFAQKKIFSVDDISVLFSAELIEPQSGMYLGFVGESSGIYLVNDPKRSSSFIDTLITDNDLFLYRGGKWNSYSTFRDELAAQKTALSAVLEK